MTNYFSDTIPAPASGPVDVKLNADGSLDFVQTLPCGGVRVDRVTDADVQRLIADSEGGRRRRGVSCR